LLLKKLFGVKNIIKTLERKREDRTASGCDRGQIPLRKKKI